MPPRDPAILEDHIAGLAPESHFGFDRNGRSELESGEDDEEFDDDGDDRETEKALIEATPRKALPGPKEKKSRSSKSSTGAVPSVPPKKTKRTE